MNPVAKMAAEKIAYKYGSRWRESLSPIMQEAAVDHELLMILLQNLDLGANPKQAAEFTRGIREAILPR